MTGACDGLLGLLAPAESLLATRGIMSTMEKVILEFKDQAYQDQLMPHLKNEVFHLTTMKAFRNIVKTKTICNNMNGQFPINCGSDNSFGRKNGCVCLFDFRGKSEAAIQETMFKYNFLGPSWFWQYLRKCKKLSIVYLILNESCYDNIVPNTVAWETFRVKGEYQQLIPETECWFPGKISTKKIKKAVFLRVREAAPSDGLLKFLHMSEYRNKRIPK
jgi:hypothetical protein